MKHISRPIFLLASPFLLIGHIFCLFFVHTCKGSYNKRGWSLQGRNTFDFPLCVLCLEVLACCGALGYVLYKFGSSDNVKNDGFSLLIVTAICATSVLLHATLLADTTKSFSDSTIKKQSKMHLNFFFGPIIATSVGAAIFANSINDFYHTIFFGAATIIMIVGYFACVTSLKK